MSESRQAVKRGQWRPVGDYIGRDVTTGGGLRTTELQHRWLIEQVIGRPLGTLEEVHHRNEIKSDNRLENLELLSKAEHTRRHFGTGRTMVQLLCAGCGAGFERDVRRRSSRFCSRVCSTRAAGRLSGEARRLGGAA